MAYCNNRIQVQIHSTLSTNNIRLCFGARGGPCPCHGTTLDQSNEALGIAPATTDKIREEVERLSDQSKEYIKITVMVKGKESASLLLCFRKTHTAQPRQ